MKTIFGKYKYILLLIIIEIILFAVNYKPGSFLVGWDNLFPEFNFPANFERNLHSIWQEYRGLGVLDGMSFAANLPHTLLVWFLALILPLNTIRYFVIFGLQLLGGIGVYKLIEYLSRNGNKHDGIRVALSHNLQHVTHDRQYIIGNLRLISFIGGLFYMLSAGTVQMFYAPFEVFSYHFAFLPILIYSILKFLDSGSKKDIFLVVLLSIGSIPQAHVPSVFIVFSISIFTLLFFRVIFYRNSLTVKRSILVITSLFLVNSFWGLPYIYSAVNRSQVIVNSKINQMTTDDVYLRNKKFGTFMNTALIHGFALDYVDYQPDGNNYYMMLQWRNHLSNPLIYLISLLFFIFTVYGIYKVIKVKDRNYYPFLFLFVFSFLMLGNDIPFLSLFSGMLEKKIPLFYNIFRFTFTKFSILFIVCYSVLLVRGIEGFFQNKNNRINLNWIIIGIIIIYSLPSFTGNFLYPNLKNNIPDSYFKLFNFFNTQDKDGRILVLPQPSYWGWTYNGWGERGSGFTWFGFGQSSLDGAFLPWSRENENLYNEITKAIYSSDRKLFEGMLEKYKVDWIVFDDSIISPFSPKALYADMKQNIIGKSGKINLVKHFENINIYKTNLSEIKNKYISLYEDLPLILPQYKSNNYDAGYLEYGDYVLEMGNKKLEIGTNDALTNNQQPITYNQIYYPFRSLFTGRRQEELEFGIKDEGDYFIFSSMIPKELEGGKLVLPLLNKEEITQYDSRDLSVTSVKKPQLYLDNELVSIDLKTADEATVTGSMYREIDMPYIKEGNLKIRVPKIKGFYSSALNPANGNLEPRNCDQFNQGIYTHEKITENNTSILRLESIGSSNCLDFNLPDLTQRIGYAITIESRNLEGKSLLFSVINKNSQRSDLETYLPSRASSTAGILTSNFQLPTSYFIIPSMEDYGMGYTLHFDNISIGRVKTVNDLGAITVNPIPYRFLTGLKIVKNSTNFQFPTTSFQIGDVAHPNPSYYKIVMNREQITDNNEPMKQSNNQYLILSQSFDPGWHAYRIMNHESGIMGLMANNFPFLFGEELIDHVLVNNWENGWRLSNAAFAKASTSVKTSGDKSADKQLPETGNRKPETIIIVYLPQYLQYIGFALLLFVPLVIFRPNPFRFFRKKFRGRLPLNK